MRAIVVEKSSGRTELAWLEIPKPTIRADEVLLEVYAAGINRADLAQSAGNYDPPAGESSVLGLECSGTIVEVGDAVTAWCVGDEVCALLAGGGYAEYVAVPSSQLFTIPKGISLLEAAALPEVACTVWSNIVTMARLRPSELVLVHGGSSGIGAMAIQIIRALGGFVACTASSSEKLQFCREIGANIAIDYRAEDFVSSVLEFSGGRGANIILDVVGGGYLSRNISALADLGRLVIIGLMGGQSENFNMIELMARRGSIIATQLRSRARHGIGSKAEVVSDVRQRLWPLIEAGVVRPTIGKTFAMPQAAAAHEVLSSGNSMGKLLLTLAP